MKLRITIENGEYVARDEYGQRLTKVETGRCEGCGGTLWHQPECPANVTSTPDPESFVETVFDGTKWRVLEAEG